MAGADQERETDGSLDSIVEARRAAFDEAARRAKSPEELIALKDAILKQYPEPEPPAPAQVAEIPDTSRLTGSAKAVVEAAKALGDIQKNAASPEEMIRRKAEYLETNAEKLTAIDASTRDPVVPAAPFPTTIETLPAALQVASMLNDVRKGEADPIRQIETIDRFLRENRALLDSLSADPTQPAAQIIE